jgi:hypothetical protein
MTSFMSVGWGPSRQVTRQAGGLQARTSEDVQGVGWAAAEAGPAESPGGPHEAGGNADPRWMAATPGSSRDTEAGLHADSPCIIRLTCASR